MLITIGGQVNLNMELIKKSFIILEPITCIAVPHARVIPMSVWDKNTIICYTNFKEKQVTK
jgi:hypothetical protein